MRRHLIRVACLGLLSALAVPSARAQLVAAPVLCSNENAMILMNPDAIACSGAWLGNDIRDAAFQAASLAQLQSDFFSHVSSGTWSLVGTTNAGQHTGPFADVPGSAFGTLSFANPITGYFALALKSGDQFSFYLFNGGDAGVSSVAYTTSGTRVDQRGVPQDLQHASLYDFAGDLSTTTVPEPSSVVLIATGLFAGIMAARRRRLR